VRIGVFSAVCFLLVACGVLCARQARGEAARPPERDGAGAGDELKNPP